MASHSTSPDSGEATPRPEGVFLTTRWTQVIASRCDSPEAHQALCDLCAAYYAPVVAFLRREGHDEDSARELAHEFFERVLQRQSLQGADPKRGRFRSYLLGALKHFLANRRVREHCQKRGEGARHEVLGPGDDRTVVADIADPTDFSPDRLFDREWAVSVIERAFAVLSCESRTAGTLAEFECLKPWLTGDGAAPPQAEAAVRLGVSEGAVRVAIHRLRRRFREVVKAEIARTVHEPAEVADELRHLIAALAS